MDSRIEEIIINAVDDAGRYPFLFIGSGMSQRYMGSLGWGMLLETVCNEALSDKFAYAKYSAEAKAAKANGEVASELPYIATLMENDVNRALLETPGHEKFRNVHEEEILSGVSPMKLFVADVINDFKFKSNDETKLISKVGKDRISGVITTNYDSLCKELFPDYIEYVGEQNLLFSEPNFAQEIFKIHGSTSEADSMVLTEADYAEFDRRRKYLAAKLLTIFVEHPVIFFGYSIQDENIKAILADICECLPEDKLQRLHDRLIFTQRGSETKIADVYFPFGSSTLPMTRITTNDFASVYEAIGKTRKMYSIKALKELKGSVFKIAENIDPKSEIVVCGFDSVISHLEPNQRLALDFTVSKADRGIPISREDIFQDVVLDDLHKDHQFIVENYLSKYVQQYQNIMPVFKYIDDLEGNTGKPIAEYVAKLTSLDDFRTKSIRKTMRSTHDRFAGHTSVSGLSEVCSPQSPFYFIPQLYDDEIDVDELEKLLRDTLLATKDGSEERMELLKDTNFRKCIRMYDFLRYRRS